jgi:hypothetical protein
MKIFQQNLFSTHSLNVGVGFLNFHIFYKKLENNLIAKIFFKYFLRNA